MATKKLYSLTDEHRAQLKPWAEKWIANALRTTPMDDADRESMVKAMRGLYAAADLEIPDREVFCAGPITGAIAASVASGVWWLRENHDEAKTLFGIVPTEEMLMGSIAIACRNIVLIGMARVRGEPEPRIDRSVIQAPTDAATDAATRAATRAATSAATRAATDTATDAATSAATDAATSAATYAATSAATSAATDAATRAATYAATYAATRAATRAATSAATRAPAIASVDPIANFLERCCVYWYKFANPGNQGYGSSWNSYLSFFRHVAKLDLPEYEKNKHYESAAKHAGPRFMHQRFWIVSGFPEIVGRDEANRAHCDDGPHLKWADGWSMYAVHGVNVPADVFERPESITVTRIDSERNAEIRRVMVEKYGRERYVRDAQFEVLSTDVNSRGYEQKLYRRRVDGRDEVFAEVQNDSPEPDGSRRVYFLGVNSDLRPMLGPGRFGEPQALTVHNARASTFGLRGEEFCPEIET